MTELAGYEFVEAIGRGAMGAVYLARQTALNRYVAAKQILGAWNGDPDVLARFQREAQALARMNHPNVVGIYDLATAGTDLFMIMEYVRGPSLRQLMDRSPLTIAQALHVLAEVAAALEYASHQGIIHRDLKPGNVFITATGVCKLGDFGLVKMLSGQTSLVTQVGSILGTPAYMAPEQAAGKAEIDQRADVYALSVIAYELLVGRLPFPSTPGNVMASLDAHISAPVPKPSSLLPGFPRQVEEAILAGLAKDPQDRPRSAGELWQKLSIGAERAWPGWAALSDLAGIAAAAAPPPPPPLPVPGVPVAASSPAANPDETMVMAAGAGAAADETMVMGHPLPPPPPPPLPPPPATPPPGTPAATSTTSAAPGYVATTTNPRGFAPLPAAVGTGASPPGAGSWGAPPVAPPVYQPPKTVNPKVQNRGGPGAVIVVLVCLVLIGAAAYYVAVTRFHVLGRDLPLTVSGASATVNGTTGKCPTHTYVFTGKVKSNGAGGKLTYEWVKPDGTNTNTASTSIPSGETESIFSLQFTFQGNGQAKGDAILHVVAPSNVKSAPAHVDYVCP
jgi:predicted Ser/Thr protein kinase